MAFGSPDPASGAEPYQIMPSPQEYDPPLQKGEWRIIPTVIVCEGANITVKDTRKAVEWWKSLGYVLNAIYDSKNKTSLEACYSETPAGFIMFKPTTDYSQMAHPQSPAAATTKRNKEKDSILWSNIHLRFKVLSEDEQNSKIYSHILAHELGHALGWYHGGGKGHMMSNYRPSWGNKGLRK